MRKPSTSVVPEDSTLKANGEGRGILRFDRIGIFMDLYIIAGPNGVGKTTFAREFLPNYADCTNFVNADLIA